MKQLGALPAEGGVEFRVWAPSASRVAVRLRGRNRALKPEDDGVWSAVLEAAAGDDYLYLLDGSDPLPDPCSRFQPLGIGRASRVVEIPAVEPGPGLPLRELVLYELHVGTFTEEGTFAAVVPHLAALRELGVTAVELMPVGTFPGMRNWGYDGVYTFAPHPAYGGPEGLAQLIDAAHGHGLGVFLDVVYNHIGPGFEAVAAFGPYFTDRHETLWGPALDYTERGVREWAIQNAELWVRDYHVDGLRLDAVDAIHDEPDAHILVELARRVHVLNPNALVVSEVGVGDLRPIEEWGHDAQWADELHHELHVALTGERDGYYARFGTPAGLARAIAGDPRRVVYAQNHDQVGNRALGDRLSSERLRVAASVVLQSPNTPLIFMGEEYGEQNAFQFFTDHGDPKAARDAREGRKREFARFAGFAGEVPDPQDEQTFLRSKLSRDETPGMRELYAELLRLRRAGR